MGTLLESAASLTRGSAGGSGSEGSTAALLNVTKPRPPRVAAAARSAVAPGRRGNLLESSRLLDAREAAVASAAMSAAAWPSRSTAGRARQQRHLNFSNLSLLLRIFFGAGRQGAKAPYPPQRKFEAKRETRTRSGTCCMHLSTRCHAVSCPEPSSTATA